MSDATNNGDVERELCGDEVNGGFIRNLCFTVWNICHSPTHKDGNSDWAEDTLPTVQDGVKYVRKILNQDLSLKDKRIAELEHKLEVANRAFELCHRYNGDTQSSYFKAAELDLKGGT